MKEEKVFVELRYDDFRKMLFLKFGRHMFVLADDATPDDEKLIERIVDCSKRRGTYFGDFKSEPKDDESADSRLIKSRWVILKDPDEDAKYSL